MSDSSDSALPSREETAALWHLQLAEGDDLSAEDLAAFEAWLADPDNAAAFREQAALWRLTDTAASEPEAVRMRGAALDSYSRANAERWAPDRRKRVGRWAVFAVAAMVVLVFGSVMWLRDAATTYHTGRGQRQVVMLDDGSRLSLDADSTVRVRLTTGRRELTMLLGRAKFDVAKDPLRPFAVTAGNRTVVATGTSFSVELLREKVAVMLYKGRVSVLDASTGGRKWSEAMEEGTRLTIPDGSTATPVLMPIEAGRNSIWEAGQLEFDREPLADALLRINRYAKTPVVAGNAGAEQVRVTGIFDATDTDAFVEGVAALNHLTVVHQPDRVVLTS